jgi:(p)ppGpp synthase/HD superfamily hydrolase
MTNKERNPDDGMIFDAIIFANEKHEGQTRKGNGLPYITHPLAVSYLVAKFKKSKHLIELVVASILHDTIEDTNTTFAELAKRFTPLVASLVFELTSDKLEIARIGKLEYLKKKMVGMSSYALLLKLLDRLHNISSGPTEKTVHDTVEILQHIAKKRKLTKPQKQVAHEITLLCADFLQRLPHENLNLAELASSVAIPLVPLKQPKH